MVTPATEASLMAVGHFSEIFDPGKKGVQLTDDSVTRLKNEFATNNPNVFFSYVPCSNDDTERLAEVCPLEMFLLQNMDVSDKAIIIAGARHTQRWSMREVDPMLCKGDLAIFCHCPTTLESLRLGAHERTPGIPRNVEGLETVEFADVLGSIAEDQHLTRSAQVCFTGTEEDQAERHEQGTIDEVLGDQDMEEGGDALEEVDREADPLEQMPLPGHPRKNVQHLVYAFLAELAFQSNGYIETCDICRKTYSCRCYTLLELHKTLSMPQRLYDAKDATTQSRDLKHTKYRHLDLVRSITKWESMCSRSLTQLVCASQS